MAFVEIENIRYLLKQDFEKIKEYGNLKDAEYFIESSINFIQENKLRMKYYKSELIKLYEITLKYYANNDIEKKSINEYIKFLNKKL